MRVKLCWGQEMLYFAKRLLMGDLLMESEKEKLPANGLFCL